MQRRGGRAAVGVQWQLQQQQGTHGQESQRQHHGDAKAPVVVSVSRRVGLNPVVRIRSRVQKLFHVLKSSDGIQPISNQNANLAGERQSKGMGLWHGEVD